MDFNLALTCTLRKHDLILVVVDRFSKMTHFIPCSKIMDASHVTHLFCEVVVHEHNLPNSIASYRNVRFIHESIFINSLEENGYIALAQALY